VRQENAINLVRVSAGSAGAGFPATALGKNAFKLYNWLQIV